MLRRFPYVVLFVAVMAALTMPVPAARAAGATEFIDALGRQALEVIRSNASPEQKTAYFHRVLHQDFDLPAIARFVLGPYWRTASPEERQEFKTVLEQYLVEFYGQRLTEYHGESFRVTGSRSSPQVSS